MDNTIDLLQIKIENAKKQLPEETLDAIAAVPWQATIIQMRETKGYSFEQLGDLELETELLLCGLLSSKDYPHELESRMKISKPAASELVEEMNKLVFSKIKEELIKISERKKIFAKKTENIPPLNIPPHTDPFLVNDLGSKHDTDEEKKNNTQILKDHGIEIVGEPIKNPPLGMRSGENFPSRPSGNPQNGNNLPTVEKLEIKAGPVRAPVSPNINIGKKAVTIPVFTPKKNDIDKIYETPKEEMHPMLAQKFTSSFQIPTVKTEHTLENITKATPPVPNDTKDKIPKMDPYREIPE